MASLESFEGLCECEAEHGESSTCANAAMAACPLCLLKVCAGCMEGDEGRHFCTVCWDMLHVDGLPECNEPEHAHRANWLVAISTSSPVIRLSLCPATRNFYTVQGYRSARFIREVKS